MAVDEVGDPEQVRSASVPQPFSGFDLQVLVDRPVYAPGETVRISVTAANHGGRFVEHHYPGWQRYLLAICDQWHRPVADDEVVRPEDMPALDRWLPGQVAIWPTYWAQGGGPIVPGRTGEAPGTRVSPGRYRARVTWLGREPGQRARLADAWSNWFELT